MQQILQPVSNNCSRRTSAKLLFGSTTTERSSPLILRTRFSMISTNPFLHPINRAESPAERTGPPLVPHFKTHGPICTTLCRLQSIDYRCTEPWDVSAITLSMKIETSETSRVLRTDSFCSVSRRPRRTRWLRSGVSLRTSRAGFPALKTSCRNRRSDSCATTTLLPLEAANERLVDLSGISRHLLELQTCAQVPRQASAAPSARTPPPPAAPPAAFPAPGPPRSPPAPAHAPAPSLTSRPCQTSASNQASYST